jgi:hypothetical protein
VGRLLVFLFWIPSFLTSSYVCAGIIFGLFVF